MLLPGDTATHRACLVDVIEIILCLWLERESLSLQPTRQRGNASSQITRIRQALNGRSAPTNTVSDSGQKTSHRRLCLNRRSVAFTAPAALSAADSPPLVAAACACTPAMSIASHAPVAWDAVSSQTAAAAP